ncbi:kinase-like domain-containing protein [Dunaliella salina]|uniref:Kinase-like domain-containing protein n=1 Tax=Dunaliella salina TaxID=3046 RepID=A0ABQ7G2H9_DUNSA|nr:kinase-like domain-containing protein [Dunaliella salina]|eukprot:KAF5828817.1 kinase-like domain-containing protein [Dunaliella salina]
MLILWCIDQHFSHPHFEVCCGPTALSNSNDHGIGRTRHPVIHSFEVQLVLEFCDKGCLREALDQGVFMGPNGLNYSAILDCAIDVARAMLHLHCNNVLHMDLKARNVMLASSGTEGRGVSCKIADFGLAVRMEQMETHMSEMFQGTYTHMAPEVLLEGRVSKAADMYAFGITLWELFTGGKPYQGVPRALLGHRVAKEGHRPALPVVMPEGYKALLKRCWDQKPENRPSFAQVVEELQELRQAEPGPTPPMEPIIPKAPKSSSGGKGAKQHKCFAGKASEELKQIQEEASGCLSSTNRAESICLPNPPNHSTKSQQDQTDRSTGQNGDISAGQKVKDHGPAEGQK